MMDEKKLADISELVRHAKMQPLPAAKIGELGPTPWCQMYAEDVAFLLTTIYGMRAELSGAKDRLPLHAAEVGLDGKAIVTRTPIVNEDGLHIYDKVTIGWQRGGDPICTCATLLNGHDAKCPMAGKS